MNAMLLALILSAPPGERSLGVAVDVLPEAFTFAAGKIGFDPRLRLISCGKADCRWAVGDDIVLDASFIERTLDIYAIEAESTRAQDASGASSRFGLACRTIVDLLQPDSPSTDQASIATAITAAGAGPVRLDAPGSNAALQFYGSRVDPKAVAPVGRRARCGARVEPAEP